jgi:hypothetical protein
LQAIVGVIAALTTTGNTIWIDTDIVNSPVIVLSSTYTKALTEAG